MTDHHQKQPTCHPDLWMHSCMQVLCPWREWGNEIICVCMNSNLQLVLDLVTIRNYKGTSSQEDLFPSSQSWKGLDNFTSKFQKERSPHSGERLKEFPMNINSPKESLYLLHHFSRSMNNGEKQHCGFSGFMSIQWVALLFFGWSSWCQQCSNWKDCLHQLRVPSLYSLTSWGNSMRHKQACCQESNDPTDGTIVQHCISMLLICSFHASTCEMNKRSLISVQQGRKGRTSWPLGQSAMKVTRQKNRTQLVSG